MEVFISPKADGSDYLHLAVNPLGSQFDARGHVKSFDTSWECKAVVKRGFWSVEFAIPFSSLEVEAGDPLRINLARYRGQRGPKEQYSCLAPVKESFHDSDRFCLLGGEQEVVAGATPVAALEGELIAYLDRSFYTRESEAKVFVDAPEGTPVRLALEGCVHQEVLPASGLIPIDLSSLAIGRYPVQVNVGGRQVELILQKLAPKKNAVKINRIHRILLVDGRPYMPFGITGSARRSITEQAKMGFDCAFAPMHRDFDEKSQKQMREALDTAQTCGTKIILWYGNHKLRDDMAKYEAELLRMVEMFKDHPALLAWWVFDEPLITDLKKLEGLCESVRKVDPYHPVFINWCDRGHGWTREMGDVTGDVNCNDGYYINCYEATASEAFVTIGGHCRDMTADAKRAGRVVSYINGIHGWTSAIREPSPEETRFMTYLTLIGGSRMLLNYTWGPPMSMELRRCLGPLGREMRILTPVVSNPKVKEKVRCDNPRIYYTAFETKDGLYVIALNTDVNDEQVEFLIKGSQGEATVLFENRTSIITDGTLKDTFKPIERHVYRITAVAAE